MTIYDVVMALGVVLVAGIIIKGLRAGKRTKPMEQPDNSPGQAAGPPGEGE